MTVPPCESIVIRFEGDSGDGIISMGKIAAKTAARLGYHVYTYSTFLAVVRGGQVTFQLRIGTKPLLSQGDNPDILVALNKQALLDHGLSVRDGGLILHPPVNGVGAETVAPGATAQTVGFEEMALDVTGVARSKNLVAAGALLGAIGLDEKAAGTAVREMFGKKGNDVAETNAQALEAGFVEGRQAAALVPGLRLAAPADPKPRMLLSGNEAVAFGALASGVRFFAGYPITPASEIMEWLATNLPKVGGTMIQAEDEIASLAMCIGASYGGQKAMTATSGPGLSLMIELLGLAGMAELPLVVVDVQRAGPSTGMPTKEAQGDLLLAAQGNHGEVPRVVLAPQSVSDCFEQTLLAVSIAHKFQIPVIVLSSQSLSHRMQTIEIPDFENMDVFEEPFYDAEKNGGEPFQRFRQTPDGMPSLRAIPGAKNGQYRAGGLEHDEWGRPDFEPETRTRMVERRRDRMLAIEREFQETVSKDAVHCGDSTIGIMSWGTSASAVAEVLADASKQGCKFSYLFPRILWPLPDLAIRNFLNSGIKKLFVCELNAMRQFAEMLRARYTAELIKNDIEVISITKDTGLPFTPGEIRERIDKALQASPVESEVRS